MMVGLVDQDVTGGRQPRDKILKCRPRGDRACGIVRITDIDHARARPRMCQHGVQIVAKPAVERIGNNIRAVSARIKFHGRIRRGSLHQLFAWAEKSAARHSQNFGGPGAQHYLIRCNVVRFRDPLRKFVGSSTGKPVGLGRGQSYRLDYFPGGAVCVFIVVKTNGTGTVLRGSYRRGSHKRRPGGHTRGSANPHNFQEVSARRRHA